MKPGPLSSVLFILACLNAHGQDVPMNREEIVVIARVVRDSITLRWAPLNYNAWRAGNEHGYIIERYTIFRNNLRLATPEKRIIGELIRPWQIERWEQIVGKNKYAAIAAQALFGDRFEVNLTESGIMSIINKARENEQRYSFALFCADMSREVAIASGLWFNDTTVIEGEQYLYRIAIRDHSNIRGSYYLSANATYDLPAPRNFTAEFIGNHVSLSWDKNDDIEPGYSAYRIERSIGELPFSGISDIPFSTLAPDSIRSVSLHSIDSLVDQTSTHRYRVRGITPFGDIGQPSEIRAGRGRPIISQPPYFRNAQHNGIDGFLMQWEFPEQDEKAIRGFRIYRRQLPTGKKTLLNDSLIASHIRDFLDRKPLQTNYYVIAALALDGKEFVSHEIFASMVDSIPPAKPSTLTGTIDNQGIVTISWKHNNEQDLFGYRVFKGYHLTHELYQVTSQPITYNSLADTIDLNTLNDKVFYTITALDKNQNHSTFSDTISIALPDKIAPTAPVLLPPVANEGLTALSWYPSPSTDVVRYLVLKKRPYQSDWTRLSEVMATGDSIYQYMFEHGDTDDARYHYSVTAVDEAGHQSDMQDSFEIFSQHTSRIAITWNKPRLDPESNDLTLAWESNAANIIYYRIYRSIDQGPHLLARVLRGDERTHHEFLKPGRHYSFYLVGVMRSGMLTPLSDRLTYQY